MGYIEDRIGVLETKVARLEVRRGRTSATQATAIEPTWTSSDGRTFRLYDLPTPYLANILRFADRMAVFSSDNKSMRGTGLADAVYRELATRTDR
jgi:hypothetical protein